MWHLAMSGTLHWEGCYQIAGRGDSTTLKVQNQSPFKSGFQRGPSKGEGGRGHLHAWDTHPTPNSSTREAAGSRAVMGLPPTWVSAVPGCSFLGCRGRNGLCTPRQTEAHLYLPLCFCLIKVFRTKGYIDSHTPAAT